MEHNLIRSNNQACVFLNFYLLNWVNKEIFKWFLVWKTVYVAMHGLGKCAMVQLIKTHSSNP